jgi:hypothetical protein
VGVELEVVWAVAVLLTVVVEFNALGLLWACRLEALTAKHWDGLWGLNVGCVVGLGLGGNDSNTLGFALGNPDSKTLRFVVGTELGVVREVLG